MIEDSFLIFQQVLGPKASRAGRLRAHVVRLGGPVQRIHQSLSTDHFGQLRQRQYLASIGRHQKIIKTI